MVSSTATARSDQAKHEPASAVERDIAFVF
jgi:hypothetical protein